MHVPTFSLAMIGHKRSPAKLRWREIRTSGRQNGEQSGACSCLEEPIDQWHGALCFVAHRQRMENEGYGRRGPEGSATDAGHCEVYCNTDWLTRRVQVYGTIGKEPIALALTVENRGAWLRSGQELIDLLGRDDVDLAVTPATNTLPIRLCLAKTLRSTHVALLH
jgi:hypothetical protein